MDRRRFFKYAGAGFGIIFGGTGVSYLLTEKYGPETPEIDDPRALSFWEEDAVLIPSSGALENDLAVDIAIIGSGITGLSAGWALKELAPGLKICIIDSHRPCSGASSRNSGHLFPIYNGWKKILASQGPEVAKAYNQFSRRGVESLVNFCQEHQIDCELKQVPLLWVGTRNQEKMINSLGERLKVVGLGGKLYTGREFQKKINMNFYYNAIEFNEHYIMHPGKLMKGLAEKVLNQGIPIYKDSPVLEIKATDSRTETFILNTRRAHLTCKKVFIATNAYTPRLKGLLSGQIVPIVLGTIITEPLADKKIISDLPWHHFTEVQLLSRTIGHTSNYRIYLRGILGYFSFNSCVGKNLTQGFKRLEKELRDRVPWTEGLKITHRWTGAVAMTYSSKPIAGSLAKRGMYFCGGYCGHGMAEGFYHSRLVAHQILELPHPDLKFLHGLSQAGWIPPEPFRSIGAKTFFQLSL